MLIIFPSISFIFIKIKFIHFHSCVMFISYGFCQFITLPIRDSFINEHILEFKVRMTPWYAHLVNYLVSRKILDKWDYNERKRFFLNLTNYF